ncbi:hypothetical protein UA08_03922 [Talaromyces atroroseus]|uniref:C2 domain-containing protein n=1 Tax=Talaromyces atroroseus TaxID=1441469 RepID=A0A225B2D5_TALAT|nr:hypothetical protein UA08_03922 [Talaromyces atroroseus]OKL60985.1 hypothetical protein UA08_03922 [Talaromyces atroroseus]
MGADITLEVQRLHMTEIYGPKFVDKAEKAHEKARELKHHRQHGEEHDRPTVAAEASAPPGGFDDTPFARVPPGYTLKFTFHRARNLPIADFSTFSSDPYVLAELKTNLPKRHKQDSNITFRTPTVRKNVNPEWDAEWIVANVPESGFHLKCRVFDEDPADHDDRLGNAHVVVDHISGNWLGIKESSYRLKKRAGSKRAYVVRTVVATCSGFSRELDAEIYISVECLGRTPAENGLPIYTLGPVYWFKHFSPLIGRLLKTSDSGGDGRNASGKMSHYNFQAIEIQLRGPVPDDLYHRYVEFRPFVAGMFTSHTLRGRILNRALHHQHARIYNYDRSTINGNFSAPCTELTELFLDFVDHGRGGRIFTYVITLDSQLRFTETGKEFGIDLLSKHTMHSDVSIYIAFSGEFFVRPRKRQHRQRLSMSTLDSRPSHDVGREAEPEILEQIACQDENNNDCSAYELIIDNDSGTYRPNAAKLPLLREFLSANFPGLHITTLDCQKDEERMKRLKDRRRAERQRTRGQVFYTQQASNTSESSLSSSDEEELLERAGELNGAKEQQQQQHTSHGLSENLHDIKDVKGKLQKWIGATDGTGEGHSSEISNEKPVQNGASQGDAPNNILSTEA